MDRETLDRLIDQLDRVRERPAMYFGRVAVEPATCWIDGFESALGAILGFEACQDARERASTSRGWTRSARHPADEMAGRGLTPAAVVDELLAVEVEVVRLLADSRRSGPDLVG